MGAMALTSGDTARHLQKLAALVTQRRVALGFPSKEAAAEACGVSHMTYRKIEGTKGVPPQPVSETTYAKLEIGFGFRPGSCKAVIEGADSIVLEDGAEMIEGGQMRDFVDPGHLQDEMDRAFDRSAQLVAPHLTQGESKAMKEEMFRHLRERGVLKSD